MNQHNGQMDGGFDDILATLEEMDTADLDDPRVLAATENAVRQLRSDDFADRRAFGYLLSGLARRLKAVGRDEDALAVSAEAVATIREFVNGPITSPMDLRGLALSLGTLSSHLEKAGRVGEAVTAADESVRLYRGLVAIDPEEHTAGLASVLNQLGNLLAAAGRAEDALAATQEAVALFRTRDPNQGNNRYGLATALNNLSLRWNSIDRPDEALEVIREAAEQFGELTRTTPGPHRLELAMMLNNVSVDLARLDRSDQAIEVAQQCVDVFRDVPDFGSPTNQALFTTLLLNLGGRLADVERYRDALRPTGEAVAITRRLAESNPVGLPQLVFALQQQSWRLAENNDHDGALAAIVESREILDVLRAAHPDEYEEQYATAVSEHAATLEQAGRAAEAAEVGESAVELFQHRAHLGIEERHAFTMMLSVQAYLLAGAGRDDEAFSSCEQAANEYRALAMDDAGYNGELWFQLVELEKLLRANGDSVQADAVRAEADALDVPPE